MAQWTSTWTNSYESGHTLQSAVDKIKQFIAKVMLTSVGVYKSYWVQRAMWDTNEISEGQMALAGKFWLCGQEVSKRQCMLAFLDVQPEE